MQLFNADESGIAIVHKPGKVVAELGCNNMYTSAEKGKTHTILSCVSASGTALLPLMVYPESDVYPKCNEWFQKDWHLIDT